MSRAMARRGVALWLGLTLLGACAGTGPNVLRAETRTAAALTPEAVWEAIGAAKDGDTVQLPAGAAVWTRGWNNGHGAKMKAITVLGAGIGKTIIGNDPPQPDAAPFTLIGVEGKPFRVSGITFDGTGYRYAGNYAAMVSVSGTCKDFRIDHCRFVNADRMLAIQGDTYGLVDHCSFEATESHGGNVQPVDLSGPGLANYGKPLNLGGGEQMYFEDNSVYVARSAGADGRRSGNNPWIAPHGAARIVIRHNTIVNAELEIYRPGLNEQYGCQQCEIYDNRFSTDDDVWQTIISVGAGVVVAFDNTVTGTHYTSYGGTPIIMMRNERAWRDLPGFPKADGKVPTDGNQVPAGQLGAGYPCFGQVGWATNVGGKFALTPCYAWDNTLNGKPLLMGVDVRADANERATVREGREFFNQEPPPGYYKPYAYPHPLQDEKAWEGLMKSAAGAAGPGGSQTPPAGP
jgi:hypothetical protein